MTARRRCWSRPTPGIAAASWCRSRRAPTLRRRPAPSLKDVVVFRRTGTPVNWTPGRDHWWHELEANAIAACPAEPLDSEHPLFILYTSGSTGKPKGILHTTGGYLLGTTLTSKWVFDLKDDDTFWCTADVGWVTGHSYIVYGPLSNGATCVMYEGAPNWPDEGTVLEDHRGLSGLDSLHGTDGHPRVHEVGRAVPAAARPLEPAAAGHRRRADQPRGLDVVLPRDRRRPLPDRRHVVADRDRRDHDLATARRHSGGARLGHPPVSRDRSRHRHQGWPLLSVRTTAGSW